MTLEVSAVTRAAKENTGLKKLHHSYHEVEQQLQFAVSRGNRQSCLLISDDVAVL